MKFAEHLSAHITPEWRKQYIQYDAMKEMLYGATETAPSTEVSEMDVLKQYFSRFEENFFQFCDRELTKINTFFSEKLAEATRKFASLSAELRVSVQGDVLTPAPRQYRALSVLPGLRQRHSDSERPTVKKIHEMKLAFSEFYLSLILLQNYQTLNFTGFRKILKKHDKLLETAGGAEWRQANVETAPFYTSKQVDHLIKETESMVTTKLEGGDRQKAMKRLRVPPLGEKQSPWTTFRVGLFAGIFLVLVLVAVLAAVFLTRPTQWEAALRMYRGTFLVLLFCFLLGINTYGWCSSGVNHVLIFELDPRHHLTHQELLELATLLGVLWAVSVICYLFSPFVYVPMFANPLCLVGFFALFMINPLPIMYSKARRWLWHVLFRIVTSPFHPVSFADFWVADQLNSLSTVVLDMEYLICWYSLEHDWYGQNAAYDGVCGGVTYAVRPLLACAPAWFRFAQCLRRYRDTRQAFPHMVNAGKYSTTFFVVLFSTLSTVYDAKQPAGSAPNAFFYVWIVSAFISTCYTFTWDVKMDWGLFDTKARENRFLRDEVVYAHKAYYYFAIVEDLVLRLSWTLTVSIGRLGIVHNEVLKTVLSALEVFRRFVWNFFRLENEHLNNCGDFRAVRDISIAPIDASDVAQLLKMMDHDDGVTNRRNDEQRRAARRRPTVWPDDDDVESPYSTVNAPQVRVFLRAEPEVG